VTSAIISPRLLFPGSSTSESSSCGIIRALSSNGLPIASPK
jgi:hypothetical protein